MTRLLADTHAVLWWLGDDDALGDAARAAIADPAPRPGSRTSRSSPATSASAPTA
jgi:hypothetical protein